MPFLTPLRRLNLPYDVYERHLVVARLLTERLPRDASVLDVGGRRDLLEMFLPPDAAFDLHAVNPDGSGDAVGSGAALERADASVDAVVSIDTLEHIAPDERAQFVAECWRAARRLLILAAPYGSDSHREREQFLHALYTQARGQSHPYLAEHVQHGLPNEAELDALIVQMQPAHHELFYAGDHTWQGDLFALDSVAPLLPRWLRLLSHLHLRAASTAIFHRNVKLTQTPKPTTNRFYLVLEK